MAGDGGSQITDVLELMRAIWALDHSLHIASKRMETLLGLTGPQRLVLRVVAANQGISAGALAEALHLHPSTLTGVIQRLEKRRYIERVVDQTDARRVRLVATKTGLRLAKPSTRNTVEWQLRVAVDKLPAAKVTATREVLGALTESLAKFAAGGEGGGRGRAKRAREEEAPRTARAARRARK